MLRRSLHFAVGLLCLAVGLRTFIAAGLMAPLLVEGSSMAPWAQGVRVRASCPECGELLEVGRDQLPSETVLPCPHCHDGVLDLSVGEALPADALWVDRTDTAPRRWSPIVFRTPSNARQLAVKRVLGLPSEKVEFVGGDLWINGKPMVKTFEQQLEVRRVEHLESPDSPGWQPERGLWTRQGAAWCASAPAVLAYGRVVMDDWPSNVALSRRFNPVSDVMLECRVECSANTQLSLSIGDTVARVVLDEQRAELLCADGRGACTLSGAPSWAVLSSFDGVALLALDGKEVLRAPIHQRSGEMGRLEIAVEQGRATFSRIAVWKDTYYEPRPLALGSPGDQPWRLGPEEYFVVGDNQSLSLDSRNWQAPPGLPSRFILGRAVRLR